MQFHPVSTYDDPDNNGITRKDKLLENKMFNEMMVLKDRYKTSMSDGDKRRLSEEYDKLYDYNYNINRIKTKGWDDKTFLNLTLSEIINKLAMTLVKVLVELSELEWQPYPNIGELMEILTKDDRMIYVGIIIVIISLLLFFIFTTS